MKRPTLTEALAEYENPGDIEELLRYAFPKFNEKSLVIFLETLTNTGLTGFDFVSLKKMSAHLKNIAVAKLAAEDYETYSWMQMNIIKITILCSIINNKVQFLSFRNDI